MMQPQNLMKLTAKELSLAFLVLTSEKPMKVPKKLENLSEEEWDLLGLLLTSLEIQKDESTIQ